MPSGRALKLIRWVAVVGRFATRAGLLAIFRALPVESDLANSGESPMFPRAHSRARLSRVDASATPPAREPSLEYIFVVKARTTTPSRQEYLGPRQLLFLPKNIPAAFLTPVF